MKSEMLERLQWLAQVERGVQEGVEAGVALLRKPGCLLANSESAEPEAEAEPPCRRTSQRSRGAVWLGQKRL